MGMTSLRKSSQTIPGMADPQWHTAPEFDESRSGAVEKIGKAIGFEPYPEQRLLLRDLFAWDPAHRRSAMFEEAVICARQQMKTGFLKLAAIGWLFVTRERLIVWSAQEFATALEAQQDLVGLIMSHRFLARHVSQVKLAAGQNEIRTDLGSRIIFRARTKKSARGLTGDKMIMDEAFALQPEMMGALLPTLVAVRDPQVVYASSAGMADSLVLRDVRDRGRAGADRLSYSEWAAPHMACRALGCDHRPGTPGCALDDRGLWAISCPVSARRDPSLEVIAKLRQSMPADEFMREILGWWDEPTGSGPVGLKEWNDLRNDVNPAPGKPSIAIDVSPDRSWASIVVAGDSDGAMHVEITSRKGEYDHRSGTDWIIPRLLELKPGLPNMKVGFAGGTAAESLTPELKRAGICFERLKRVDVIAACGNFLDLVRKRKLAHLGQSELDDAVLGAREKKTGGTAFVWISGNGSDITPLYAACLAIWMADNVTDVTQSIW